MTFSSPHSFLQENVTPAVSSIGRRLVKRLSMSTQVRAGLLLAAIGWVLLGPSATRTIETQLSAQGSDPCAGAVNPIVCENSKPGNPKSEWDLPGNYPQYGDLNIQGFATEMSVGLGETVHFKVNTDAHAYRLDIYRLGYYGGLGARKVATVHPDVALPQDQPPCLFVSATRLVDCGNLGRVRIVERAARRRVWRLHRETRA